MTSAPASAAAPDSSTAAVFDRIVCGVDLGGAGRVAAQQAAQLVPDDGSLLLVTATVGEPVTVLSPAGLGYVRARTAIDASTRERYCDALTIARQDALQYFGETRMLRVEGDPLSSLLDCLERERATLAVVGSHETGRLPGILLGSVATNLLHTAPCSVLIARGTWPEERPHRIVVGVDGSSQAAAALRAAHDLSGRLGSPVEQLTDRAPVRALVASARGDDLIVVGSRGLHGMHALGSVSERVAHEAPCSVLVVRPTRWEVEE